MKSIQFPKMFRTNSTLVTDTSLDATKQNLHLLLSSEKGELFGDPYFGIKLKAYLFDQNSYVLKDILIDEIYTQLAIFIPQLKVVRSDIDIIQNKQKSQLICKFKGTNQIDFTTDMYSLVLFSDEQK